MEDAIDAGPVDSREPDARAPNHGGRNDVEVAAHARVLAGPGDREQMCSRTEADLVQADDRVGLLERGAQGAHAPARRTEIIREVGVDAVRERVDDEGRGCLVGTEVAEEDVLAEPVLGARSTRG